MHSLKDAAYKVGGPSKAGDLDFDQGPRPKGSEDSAPPAASGVKKRTIAKATGSGRTFAATDGSAPSGREEKR